MKRSDGTTWKSYSMLNSEMDWAQMTASFTSDAWSRVYFGRPRHGELGGKTLGLVGFGHIGKEVARRAAAFGMRILAVATSERPEYIVAATVGIAQAMIGVGIALTGGPTSPAIPLLLLPMVTLPARFGTHGVQAGMGVSLAVRKVPMCTGNPNMPPSVPSGNSNW